MDQKANFVDILKPRNTPFGIFNFMTKVWEPKKSVTLDKDCKPQMLKKIVLDSIYVDSFLEAESRRTGIPKQHLKSDVVKYLDEIAMDKKLHVIRWMGIVFLKISFMMKIGMYVDDAAVLKLRESLGKNPVLFLPTHRSYADFCLLTYLCFHYDIELPAVAAGMDFYSMAVVGQSMRETGAFYMRRTLIGAPLYAATFRHYVRTLVAKHNAPVEFFLEGTRSRSNKSLAPKYGILSMSLVPYFTREVSDITIVPINISYDRLMEQGLFAYEHLGVPKPKETTGGLLKSLHKLNDNYGNIYVKFGDPISLNKYLGDQRVSAETLMPLDLQYLNTEQLNKVQNIAEHVVTLQQKNTVVTITNLLAIVLMDSIIKNEALTIEEVRVEVEWLIGVLQNLGATVFETDVKSSVDRILVVHKSMMTVEQNKLRLISSDLMTVSPEVQKKMKGHILKAESIVNAVPIIELQLYVNPVLHYLISPAIVYLLVNGGVTRKEKLYSDYYQIRILLCYEFFHVKKDEIPIFEEALEYCVRNKLIRSDTSECSVTVSTRVGVAVGGDERGARLLRWAALPALCTLRAAAQLITEKKKCEHKLALKLIQEAAEERRCHPYCLSLDAAANCLRGLVLAGAITRTSRQKEVNYEAHPTKIEESLNLINYVMPNLNLDFGVGNSVIISQKLLASKL